MTMAVSADALALQRLYHWERTAPDRVVLTQPLGGGVVRDYTWREVLDQARRMAAHLQGLGLRAGRPHRHPRQEHRALADERLRHLDGRLRVGAAVPDAGRRHDPADPRAQRGASCCSSASSTAGSDMKPGVPAGLPCIAPAAGAGRCEGELPALGRHRRAHRSRCRASRCAPATNSRTIIYTSGTTGMPKGVMHSFATFAWAVQTGLQAPAARRQHAHAVATCRCRTWSSARWSSTACSRTGMHVYFAESLETFAADMQRARPTVFFSVPRLWVKFQQGVLAQDAGRRSSTGCCKLPIVSGIVRKKILTALGLDQCVFAAGGAAPMPPDLLRWYARLGLEIVEVLRHDRELRRLAHHACRGKQRPGTVGRPTTASSAGIDPDTGEIQVKSPAHDARLLQGARADARRRSPTTAGCAPATRARSTPRAT